MFKLKFNSRAPALFLLGFLLLTSPVFALPIPEKPQSHVNDYAGLLSLQTRNLLETTLEDFEKTTSTQVVVAIFESLEGGSLEDFSIRLAEQWKIGNKNKDNGVILLIFKNDRAVRIEVGYGLEGVLTDALSSQIIRNQMVPAFRAGDFDKGVSDGVNAILAVTRGEYHADAAVTPEDPLEKYKVQFFFLLILYLLIPLLCYGGVALLAISIFGLLKGAVIAIPVIIALVVLRSLFSASQTFSGRPGGFGGGGWGGGSWGGGGFGSGGFSGGGGGFGGGGSSGRW